MIPQHCVSILFFSKPFDVTKNVPATYWKLSAFFFEIDQNDLTLFVTKSEDCVIYKQEGLRDIAASRRK